MDDGVLGNHCSGQIEVAKVGVARLLRGFLLELSSWKVFQSRCHGGELGPGTRLGEAAAELCTGAGTKAEAQAPAAAWDM